jgi:hypothetical protein
MRLGSQPGGSASSIKAADAGMFLVEAEQP